MIQSFLILFFFTTHALTSSDLALPPATIPATTPTSIDDVHIDPEIGSVVPIELQSQVTKLHELRSRWLDLLPIRMKRREYCGYATGLPIGAGGCSATVTGMTDPCSIALFIGVTTLISCTMGCATAIHLGAIQSENPRMNFFYVFFKEDALNKTVQEILDLEKKIIDATQHDMTLQKKLLAPGALKERTRNSNFEWEGSISFYDNIPTSEYRAELVELLDHRRTRAWFPGCEEPDSIQARETPEQREERLHPKPCCHRFRCISKTPVMTAEQRTIPMSKYHRI